ncbi:plant UBX domain-containing protein 7 [Nymphaea colorata]|uniref:plant UBX domain-containing protein 7 n=1 Tax=Nymphaea colorata TaxID=210225 RepID=UPI00129E2FD4|nr:plant UBX domain-containing protein 7 [Nymphaea colorata]
MESGLSDDHQGMLVSFMEITACDSTDKARQFLQVTNWQLEEAIQLFYVGSDGSGAASTSVLPSSETTTTLPPESSNDTKALKSEDEDNVRPPLPVKREALYADSFIYGNRRPGYPSHQPNPVVAFRNFADEAKHVDVWDSNRAASSTSEGSRDNLASLYRPPFDLMYQGTFEQAKLEAARVGKWLIVNLQSTKEFSSHMLNRDTWSNEAVAQTISTGFIFWQIYDDTSEGKKVCTYYNLVNIPVVLVIDPITGQKMRSWCGMVEPEHLLEDLIPYMDKGPKDHHIAHPCKRMRENAQNGALKSAASLADNPNEEDEDVLKALAASLEDVKRPALPSDEDKKPEKEQEPEVPKSAKPLYPVLPDEPKCDSSLLCKILVRLPDGQRFRRNFLRTDSIQLLWSFCCSILKEAESRPFHLTQAIPGASKHLDFNSNQSFEEAGLSNSMISLTWE